MDEDVALDFDVAIELRLMFQDNERAKAAADDVKKAAGGK